MSQRFTPASSNARTFFLIVLFWGLFASTMRAAAAGRKLLAGRPRRAGVASTSSGYGSTRTSSTASAGKQRTKRPQQAGREAVHHCYR